MRQICVETKIMDDERLIIDELKALMIKNETEEYLTFKKVDQSKLKDVIKKSKRGEKKEPWWKIRIESDITNLRINRLERERLLKFLKQRLIPRKT